MIKKGISKYCKEKLAKDKAIECKGWIDEAKQWLQKSLFNNYQDVVIDDKPCQKNKIYKEYYYTLNRMKENYSCFKP